MGQVTRRKFVGGFAAGGLGGAIGGRLLTADAVAGGVKPCAPTPPGIRTAAIAVSPSGRTIWTADAAATTITAHRARDLKRGRSIDVGGAPIDIAVSPDGTQALVVSAFYDRPGLALVDLRSGEITRFDVGPEPRTVVWGRGGRSAYVAGGGANGTLTKLEPASGRIYSPIAVGAHPRGLALMPGGRRALVALNGDAAIAVVDLRRRVVARRIATRPFPYRVAVARDAKRARVTHNGFDSRAVSQLDLEHWRASGSVTTGRDPAGVAIDRSGTVAVVANTGAGTISVLDARSLRRRRRVRTNGTPQCVAIAGRRAYVADGQSGALTAIRLGVVG